MTREALAGGLGQGVCEGRGDNHQRQGRWDRVVDDAVIQCGCGCRQELAVIFLIVYVNTIDTFRNTLDRHITEEGWSVVYKGAAL